VLLKAVMIHTARDLGRPGPDYEFGYGIVDAELAAKVIGGQTIFSVDPDAASPPKKKPNVQDITSRLILDEVDNKDKNKYEFEVPDDMAELRVTIVWHDYPGAGLVNDLDLWIKGPAKSKGKPFALDPANPTKNAVQKSNKLDNVEHILFKKPPAGKWKIYVKGAGVAVGPQEYALVISAGTTNNQPVVKKEGRMDFVRCFTSSGDWDDDDQKTTFNTGDDLYCYLYVQILENAHYEGASSSPDDDYYGALYAVFRILDSSGKEISRYPAATNAGQKTL
jgi:hypothetical protein